MDNDLKEAQENIEAATVFAGVAVTSIKREDVDCAEASLLHAINKLTSALVNLRNFRVC